jgi:hypothetical protein
VSTHDAYRGRTGIRFTADDARVIAVLRQRTGLTMAGVVRVALRELLARTLALKVETEAKGA